MMEAKELLWRDYTVDECMSCARGMPHDDDVIRAKLGWRMADEIERLRGLLHDWREQWGDGMHPDGDLIDATDAALAGAAVQPTVRMGITDGWPRCLTCENDLVPGTFWCAEHQPTDPVTTSPAPAAKCACAEYYPGLPHHPDCPTRNADPTDGAK